jgi:hypothetical protein
MEYKIDFIVNLELNITINNSDYIKFNNFNNFLLEYNNFKDKDSIPIFNNSTKFNNKNKKYYKNKNNTQCIFIRNSSAWTPNSSTEIDKEIKNSITSNLNKLSTNNFDTISDILIHDIKKTDNPNIFNILCDELLNKNIYDTDYQNEYVKLCIKIFNENIDMFEMLYKSNNKYYWKKNGKYVGPYDSPSMIHQYFDKNFIFKRILLNKLYDKFNNRLAIYEEIMDTSDIDIKYKKKRNILSIVEFICKLFIKKVITFDIIYLIHISLFDINTNLDYINLNIEVIYNIWGILKKVDNSLFNINHINTIFYYIKNKLLFINTSYRIEFFIESIHDIIKSKFAGHINNRIEINDIDILCNECKYLSTSASSVDGDSSGSSDSSANNGIPDACYIEDELIYNLNNNNLYDHICSNNPKDEYLDTLIYIVLNDFKHKDKCVDCIQKLKDNNIVDMDILNNLVSHTDDEINEMAMDNYKVKDNFKELYKIFNESIIV